ncbi:MAG: class I SAM-dependent methyltransferase [Blastocatellales bacterium]
MTQPVDGMPVMVERMKRDWDDRAREDARWYINSLRVNQTDDEFDRTGIVEVERLVLADLDLLTGGRDPRTLSLLEIGCGAGRMTKHLAAIFGRVTGIDVSGEMIRQAAERLAGIDNVALHETSGVDFPMLPDQAFDLIISAYVFQHVPSADVIASNLRDAWRVLKPGGVLRFQTNAISRAEFDRVEKDTWVGAAFTEPEIRRFARERSARLISIFGAGTQYCWTTIRKTAFDQPNAGQSPRIVLFGSTYDAECREISCRGDRASLTLILTGIEGADCNDLIVRIGETDIAPRYVGPIGGNFRAAIDRQFGNNHAGFTQVEIGVPESVSPGIHPVTAIFRNCSVTTEVAFSDPKPGIPVIRAIANAEDGGLDIHSTGPKSRVHILIDGVSENSLDGEIEIEFGAQIVKPQSAGFLPEKQLIELIARLPENLRGRIEVRVRIGEIQSQVSEIIIE